VTDRGGGMSAGCTAGPIVQWRRWRENTIDKVIVPLYHEKTEA